MRHFILVVLLVLACSKGEPFNPFANNSPPDEGVTRTFDASGSCFDCSGASARKYCLDMVGYQELISFTCGQDVSTACLSNGPAYCKCRGKRYLRMVTCWKAR